MKIILIKKRYPLMLILILILGVALRIFNLGKFDFWYDEALNILQAKNIAAINFLQDNNPPLYTVFLHFWSEYFDSEFGLRLASAIFGSISIIMFFVLAKLLFTKKVGLISAFLLAISPMHIYYSQEARMYSLVALLNIVLVYFLIKSIRKGSIGFWVGFVFFSISNIYCHYIGVLSWLAQLIFFFVYQRQLDSRVKMRWLAGNIVIFLSFIPWFYFLFKGISGIEKNLSKLNISPWGPPVSFLSIYMTFKNFTAGYNASIITYLPITLVFLSLFIRGILKLRPKNESILCLLYLLVPISIAYFAYPIKLFYLDRFFIGSSLFYLLIVGNELSYLRTKALFSILLAIALLTSFSLLNYYKNIFPCHPETHQWILRKINHKAMTKYIYDRRKKGDYIFHTCPTTIFPFVYYSNKLGGSNNLFRNNNFLLILPDGANKPVACEFSINFGVSEVFHQIALEGKDRFWLVLSYWNFERMSKEYPAAFFILEWADKNYKVIEKKEFDGAVVFLYEKWRNI